MPDNNSFDELFKNPMKSKSVDEISETIANAISDLLGQKMEVNIKSINFEPEGGNLLKATRIELNIQQPLKDKFHNL